MMRLQITSVADRGNGDKERIVMKATADIDVGRFAIFRAGANDEGAPTSDVADVFWFPDKAVKARDLVVLYTKAGKTSERPSKSGGTVHFFYWGRPNPLWSTSSGRIPVLVSTNDWEWLRG
jgi:hypothetical protein